ncbi:MAG: transglycosylase SLT domain-containing protein [Nitrospirae bacterium]|nr:transglycosylase SLT domain-containing protein [Nitrospirota bacterium]
MQLKHIKELPLIFFIFPLLALILQLCPSAVLADNEPAKTPEKQFKDAVNFFNSASLREAEAVLLQLTEDEQQKGRVFFLLGRIYKEQRVFDKAEEYFKKSVDSYPVLRDYALKSLADIYIASERFDKALEILPQIQNRILLKDVRKSEIMALLGAKQEERAIGALQRYAKDYPNGWELKFNLAMLLKQRERTNEAVSLFKDIYINAVPQWTDALRELKEGKADIFTAEELLKRADKFFEKGNFQRAEEIYREVITQSPEHRAQNTDNAIDKNKVAFSIGMCQFRQRQYDKSSKTFGLLEDAESVYLEALSYFRINDTDNFNLAVERIQRLHPKDERFAKLLLVSADDLRRKRKNLEAEEIFKRVLNEFPSKAEEALWGLGWMSYLSGNYEGASRYFSRLTEPPKKENQDRYLYWQAKSLEKLIKSCEKAVSEGSNNNEGICSKDNNSLSKRLPQGTGYYSYLVKLRTALPETPKKIEPLRPGKPKGEVYDRIEALILLSMKAEAAGEIRTAMQDVEKPEELLYLGYAAMDTSEYRRIISIAEAAEREEFLPLSYPLGYMDIIKKASEGDGIDAYLVAALIREESRFDPNAVSRVGAIGLMQIMPSTAKRVNESVNVGLKNGSELHDAEKNIMLGTRYLSTLIKRFKEIPLAVAAYNAGENALQKWLEQYSYSGLDEFIEDIPYTETRNYVKKVLRSYWQYRRIEGLPLFTF